MSNQEIYKNTQKKNRDEKIKIEYIHNPEDIYKNLHFGTNLPITEEFKEYIFHEIGWLNVFSIIIKGENGEVIGHSCVYLYNKILHFAFFSVLNTNKRLTHILINELEKIALKEKCDSIKGPLNFPSLLYGWGFSEEGSDKSIFAAAPYTDPLYIEHFQNEGFSISHHLLRFRMKLQPISFQKNWKIETLKISENESWKDEFIDFHYRLFPDSSVLTPKRDIAFGDYLDIISKYGYDNFIYVVKDKGRNIAIAWATPNPFDLNEDRKCKSILFYGAAVEPEYQGKGVLNEIVMQFNLNVGNLGIKLGEWPFGADNIRAYKAGQRLGGKQNRSYVILEYKLNEKITGNKGKRN